MLEMIVWIAAILVTIKIAYEIGKQDGYNVGYREGYRYAAQFWQTKGRRNIWQ
ncbi:hypothetical protein [Sporosarcina sp. ITBMC105]